ncbi:MAG: hypothetical protein Q4A78_04145 [Peptostreptococcaceae bacterium]|nr:hypothetical protein [Peptostreptococcaceae bacterium]
MDFRKLTLWILGLLAVIYLPVALFFWYPEVLDVLMTPAAFPIIFALIYLTYIPSSVLACALIILLIFHLHRMYEEGKWKKLFLAAYLFCSLIILTGSFRAKLIIDMIMSV